MFFRHQRSANKELAQRLGKLEEKMMNIEGGEILVSPSEVIMRDYTPHSSRDTEEISETFLNEKIEKRLKSHPSTSEIETNKKVSSEEVAVMDRPPTPDYNELNERFQNLLSVLSSRNNSEIVEDDDDEVFDEDKDDCQGSVMLSCSKPPDILDFTKRADIDMEEVEITLDGLEIINDNNDDDLPAHIKTMVNRAMMEMK